MFGTRSTTWTRRAGAALLSTGLAFLVSSMVVPIHAAADDAPGGNNGTVKVEGTEFNRIPENNPHESCTFTVEWRGYDKLAGLKSTIDFTVQEPTDPKDKVILHDELNIASDPAGGANDLDATKVYSLNFTGVTADDAHHGAYHVMLTVDTDGSKGADVKHKVFWVGPCGGGTTTTTSTSTTTTTSIPTTVPNSGTTTVVEYHYFPTPTTTTTVVTTTTTTPTPTVLGIIVTRPAPTVAPTTAAPEVAALELPRTGGPVRQLMLLAGFTLVLGGVLVLVAAEPATR